LAVDVTAASGHRAQNAIALQVLIGPRHCIWIDTEFGGQLAYWRKRVVLLKRPRGNGVLYLRFDLQIDGDAKAGLDADDHLY